MNVCKEGKLWSTVWVNQPLIELRSFEEWELNDTDKRCLVLDRPINRYRDSRSPSPHRRYRREDDQVGESACPVLRQCVWLCVL